MQDFSNKVVVIPGGATGIGYGFAKAFGAEGAKIVLAARRENRLQEAAAQLKAEGIDATYALCDVSRREDIEALADFAWDWQGHVDVMVNNAGISIPQAPLLDLPVAEIERIFAVNFYGVLHGSQVFGKRFVEQGTPAAIYNVGSENSLFHAVPLSGPYVATKHALLAITESLYEELPEFVDVSLICPGFVVSEIGPEEQMQHGMPTDEFVAIAMKQLKANQFFVVSHAYNIERIEARYQLLKSAFDTYAPRYDGDAEYDVRTLVEPLLQEQAGLNLRKVSSTITEK